MNVKTMGEEQSFFRIEVGCNRVPVERRLGCVGRQEHDDICPGRSFSGRNHAQALGLSPSA